MEEKNMELLIEEIEKRPALYIKELKEYSCVDAKRQLWDDICRVVIRDWDGLSMENKIKTGHDVQRKWQSLRNCFARELRNQRKAAKSGPSAKKRRKYIYYDKLLFLLPTIEQREITHNGGSNDDSDEGVFKSTNKPKPQASTPFHFTSFPRVSKTLQPVLVDDVSSVLPCTSVLPNVPKVLPELLPFLRETNIPPLRTKKRDIEISEAEDTLLLEATKCLQEGSNTTDPYLSYGINIANELRKYDQHTLAYVKQAINNIIFEADIGNFTQKRQV